MLSKKQFFSIICISILLLIVGFYVFITKDKKDNIESDETEYPIPTSLSEENKQQIYTLTDKVSLLLTTPDDRLGYKQFFYLDEETQTQHLLAETSNRLSLYMNEDSPFFSYQDLTVVAVYEYSDRKITDDFQYERKGYGHIFLFDTNGTLVHSYTTTSAFEKISIKESDLSVFEKIFEDPTRMYPRHLKPYYLIEKRYIDGEFKEVNRVYKEPIKELEKEHP